ncbi:MAG TPA: peroxiredoxin [Baekduia sp.]|nr:peroxiredoxin [Baekduia sp.]
MTDPTQLPADLPEPEDDGAARHLPELAMPPVALHSTTGATVQLDKLGDGRTVLYLYPMTGQPGEAMPDRWDTIPGARGCTPEACAFRDHHADLLAAGADAVYGLSSQSTEEQVEAVTRLHLPFPLLSDPALQLADQLRLPTFEAGGKTRYRRVTLIITAGTIEHVFYPVFPPDSHAGEVLRWLRDRSGPPLSPR